MAEAAVEEKPKTLKELKKELQELTLALEKAQADEKEEMITSKAKYVTDGDKTGWVGYSSEVYEKFFLGYKGVAALIDSLHEQILTRMWVASPIWRRRVMYRVLTGSQKFKSDAQRRAVNSPIQGFSSEVGVNTGRQILIETYRYMKAMKIPMKYFTIYCRAVHDASYFEEAYRMIIPAIHINQHVATVGVTEYYLKTYGFKMNLAPEIEIHIGPSDARAKAWNWVLDDLPPLIIKAVEGRIEDGYLEAEEKDATIRAILKPWIKKESRQYLQEHYPLLQVKDLDEEICLALERSGFKPER